MSPSSPHLTHPKYRADIDGLRAIAVSAVVAFHAFPGWLRGGFIGVDVFFVISGYLISTIIFESLDRGVFSFSEFYARRIRRIFPALIVVLIACFAFGWFALLADEYKQLGKHIAAGAGFISNLILWGESGYFDNAVDTKPLLHLWSLGIEEQFYVVWPLLLWLAWKRKFNLFTIIVLVAVASFVLNLNGVSQDLVATFYSPQTRFWELLSGSLLAWCTLYKQSFFANLAKKANQYLCILRCREKHDANGQTLVNLLAFVGLMLLAYGFWRISKDLIYPGKWALVPVVGTILLLMAGPKAWINHILLSNKFFVEIGLISYPLYLWHWPTLSFARIIEGRVPSDAIRIGAVALSILLSWGTYKLIEHPIRFGRHGKTKSMALIVLVTITGYVGYYTYDRGGLENYRWTGSLKTKFSDVENKRNCSELDENPGADDYCFISPNRYPNPKIMIVGDSHANMFTYVFEKLNDVYPGDFDFIQFGRGSCQPLLNAESPIVGCRALVSKSFEYAKANSNISTVVIVARWPSHTTTLYTSGLEETISSYQGIGKKIIIVLKVPDTGNPRSCIYRPIRFSSLSGCDIPIERAKKADGEFREYAFDLNRKFPEVAIFDPWKYLCSSQGCKVMNGLEVFYSDDSHISRYGGNFIADNARNELLQLLK